MRKTMVALTSALVLMGSTYLNGQALKTEETKKLGATISVKDSLMIQIANFKQLEDPQRVLNNIIKFRMKEGEENLFKKLPMRLQVLYAEHFDDVDNSWFEPIGKKSIFEGNGEYTIGIFAYASKEFGGGFDYDMEFAEKVFDLYDGGGIIGMSQLKPYETNQYWNINDETGGSRTEKKPNLFKQNSVVVMTGDGIVMGVISGDQNHNSILEFIDVFIEERLHETVFKNTH